MSQMPPQKPELCKTIAHQVVLCPMGFKAFGPQDFVSAPTDSYGGLCLLSLLMTVRSKLRLPQRASLRRGSDSTLGGWRWPRKAPGQRSSRHGRRTNSPTYCVHCCRQHVSTTSKSPTWLFLSKFLQAAQYILHVLLSGVKALLK